MWHRRLRLVRPQAAVRSSFFDDGPQRDTVSAAAALATKATTRKRASSGEAGPEPEVRGRPAPSRRLPARDRPLLGIALPRGRVTAPAHAASGERLDLTAERKPPSRHGAGCLPPATPAAAATQAERERPEPRRRWTSSLNAAAPALRQRSLKSKGTPPGGLADPAVQAADIAALWLSTIQRPGKPLDPMDGLAGPPLRISPLSPARNPSRAASYHGHVPRRAAQNGGSPPQRRPTRRAAAGRRGRAIRPAPCRWPAGHRRTARCRARPHWRQARRAAGSGRRGARPDPSNGGSMRASSQCPDAPKR